MSNNRIARYTGSLVTAAPSRERRYRELVEAYVVRNVLLLVEPRLDWNHVVSEVRALGKTLDQFAQDWRAAVPQVRQQYRDL